MNQASILSLLFTFMFSCSTSFAQDDEFKPGLLGTYQASETIAQRVDSDISFNWGKLSPDYRIHDAEWSVEWTGQILVRKLSPYQLHAELNGDVEVVIDEQPVFTQSTEDVEWVSGETLKIAPGFRDIKVTYQPSSSGAVIKLFWSNEEFAVEPIPTHLLFHADDDSQLKLIERGRSLVVAHQCENCHRSEQTIDHLESAPPFWGAVSGTNPDWIVEKILGHHAEAKTDQMPNFGFSEKQAEDIAAYLHRLEAPFDLMTAPDSKPKKGELDGRGLFNSMGCLACHQVDGLGNQSPFSGGDLSQIGHKRSLDWLATWLSTPDRLNPAHRMPVFKLSRTERGLLAKYLSSLGKTKKSRFGRAEKGSYTESSVRGQNLVKEFQCANCHKIPAIEATNKPVAPLTHVPESWERSCLSPQADPEKHRPSYPHIDRKAIAAYLGSLSSKPEATLSQYEQGRLLIEQNNCLACHSRGATQGLKSLALDIVKATPALQGKTQLVIPPSLNAVGDKLQDAVLDVALAGKQDRVRADWLKVRMPQFNHTAEELKAIKHYLVEHDRIPQQGSQQHPELDLTEQELLLIGRKLVGAGGWSCIACHQIGDYVPKNTALGTRGSDLMAIGKRLRPEFYYRWTAAPIRVIPGMEMPSFVKPVPGVLDEDAHKQLGVIFKAMNDPRFEPPTNPSQVEQLWQVAEISPPRIVRDVFTVSAANGGGAVARALAIGFSNQHGLLFDLDTMTLRDWTYGDFARQKTIGKSWYWDLAGTGLVKGLGNVNDLVLFNDYKQAEEIVGIAPDRITYLSEYKQGQKNVRLRYEVRFNYQGESLTIPVVEEISPVQRGSEEGNLPLIGWQRRFLPQSLPAGLRLGLRLNKSVEFKFPGSIEPIGDHDAHFFDSSRVILPPSENDTPQAVTIQYLSTVSAPRTNLPEKKLSLAITDQVKTFPGYVGQRLPLPTSVMATAITKDRQGRVLITSLKGDVYRVSDQDGDGTEESYELIQEGLSAPFGIATEEDSILVTHKPELLRITDQDGDGIFESREVTADGWGFTDNYHDWITGPAFDHEGNLFVATGSDYSQKERDRDRAKWRGKVVRIDQDGKASAFGHELRYPIGIAADSQGNIFTSDQQGVQNTFNEINHIVENGAYGVPGQLDGEGSSEPKLPAVQIPHPWTRSVNGIFFLPEGDHSHPFAGHGVGCEYNSKFLIRFTTQNVNGQLQGACYPLTKPTWNSEGETFLGPISGYAAEDGSIYIGSIYDSGWLGGPNVGEVVKLKPVSDYGNGIQEIRATKDGFEIEFITPVDANKAVDAEKYSLSGYTRIWQGSYATDDSGRYSPEIKKIELAADERTVRLTVNDLKPTFVYEFNVGAIGSDGEDLFPSFAAYTLNQIPE